jgi:hypothetical protein
MSKKLYEEKVIKYQGAKHYLIKTKGSEHFKHHRYDGPAIDPINKDSKWKKSFYLGGIEYGVEEYAELMAEREGLPWYKQTAPKGTTYRN